jgi:NADPH-dependent curcumin reductase CurA
MALAHPKCKVIALASKSKLAQLEKLGCHTVLDYTDPGFKKNLRKATEGLIDVYFDNGKSSFFSH